MNTKTLPHNHGQHEEDIMLHIPGDSEITEVSNAMKQLGDPTRLRIFWLLCHCEECVVNIASMVDMSSPAVSHHLKLLKIGNLISSRRKGKEMYYKAADNEITLVLHHVIEQIARITCPEEDDEHLPFHSPSHLINTPQPASCDAALMQLVAEIHALLTTDLSKRYTIEELSKQYLINTSTLKSAFKSAYGLPIATYMKQYRINKAAQMLHNTDDTIAQIANAVGYESQSKFTTAFKAVTGMLPTSYRHQKKTD